MYMNPKLIYRQASYFHLFTLTFRKLPLSEARPAAGAVSPSNFSHRLNITGRTAVW
jgi:hypothetical protein